MNDLGYDHFCLTFGSNFVVKRDSNVLVFPLFYFCFCRFEQPNAANSNQQFRPPSQPGMVAQQQHPEQMYPNRYGSNQQMTSVRSHTPQHDQYAAQGGYPNQSNTFNSPRGVVPQEQYQNYPNQQAGFAGHRPPSSREVPAGNMYGTPNKRYPPDVERRENFNMSGKDYCQFYFLLNATKETWIKNMYTTGVNKL